MINFPAEQRYEGDDNMVSSPHKLSKIGPFFKCIWISSRLKSNGTAPARE